MAGDAECSRQPLFHEDGCEVFAFSSGDKGVGAFFFSVAPGSGECCVDGERFGEEFAGAEGGLFSKIAGGFHGGGGVGFRDAKVAPLRAEAAGERLVVHMPLDAVRSVEAGSDLSSIGKPDWEAVAIRPIRFHERAASKCLQRFIGVHGECSEEEQEESQRCLHG